MRHRFDRAGMAWLAVALALGCTAAREVGDQCVFNDDCADPLVCAGRRCRVQCRSGRDCAPGHVCIPSESPLKQVCVPEREPALCGASRECPAGAACRDGACWWTCRDDGVCAGRQAGRCLRVPGVCEAPVTAGYQATQVLPALLDGGAKPDDAAVAIDATGDADAATVQDVVAAGDASRDGPAFDAPTCASDGQCVFANAAGVCRAGRCAMGACRAGFGDCDGDPESGCEVALAASVEHCGRCGGRCLLGPGVARAACVAGACAVATCAEGFADCDGMASTGCEVDTRTSLAHCGACGVACATPTDALGPACTQGRCAFTMCRPGRADCDGLASNGCETDLTASTDHCGACRSACPRAPGGVSSCVAGACVVTCAAGRADCNRDTSDGCEVTLALDPDHCRACGARCGAGQACGPAGCVAVAYAAGDATRDYAPTADEVLPAGVHRFRSVTIPRGVTVRTTAPGVLEVYARGEVRIEGTVDVSGGDGGGDGAPSSSCAGGNGGGGATGTTARGGGGTTSCNGGGEGGVGTPGGAGALAFATCGAGGAFGGGAGGSLVCAPVDCGGGGGGGGGHAGGGGGGGFGNAAGGGRGGGESDAPAFVAGGGTAGACMVPAYAGVSGQSANGNGGAGGGGGGSIGTDAARDQRMTSTFRPGSGGGGGGAFGSSLSDASRCVAARVGGGGGGGGGGGALRIASATRIVVAPGGRLLANGGRGGSTTRTGGVTCVGAGGGGSGGAVHLAAPALEMLGTVSAQGGQGGASPIPGACGGGAGGVGRIHVTTNHAHCARGGVWAPDWNGAPCQVHPDAPGRLTSSSFP